jgi:hypothetical protein
VLPVHDCVVTPHGVVLLMLLAKLHAVTPVVQETVPLWQALLLGEHPAPGVQAEQVPLLQNMFVPHDAPGAAFVGEQTGTLVVVAHVSMPVLHVCAGLKVHPLPAPEHVHTPLLQVWPI